MNHNYIRPGGVAADLPDRLARRRAAAARHHPASRSTSTTSLLTGQPIWQRAAPGRRRDHRRRRRSRLGATGPILRSTGVPWDLRRTMPYLHYDEVEFDVVVGTYGDCFDRYAIRLNEVRESMQIVRQILDQHAGGRLPDPGQEGHAAAAGRIDESMEALDPPLQDLHRGLQGARGRGLRAPSSRRGEIGCYIVSDGSAKPYRMHIRAPIVRQPADACRT